MGSRPRISVLPIAAVVVLAIAIAVGAFVIASLDNEDRQELWLEVGKLSWQAVVIVLLGFLLKAALDDSTARKARREGVDRRRSEYIRRLIDVSHKIECARWFIIANRSIKTYDIQMQNCVAAFVELRDIRHDVVNDSVGGQQVFANWNDFQPAIEDMERYLEVLIGEYAENKKRLSELQIAAEKDRRRQVAIWREMNSLPSLGGLLAGTTYGHFRDLYRDALSAMRDQSAPTA